MGKLKIHDGKLLRENIILEINRYNYSEYIPFYNTYSYIGTHPNFSRQTGSGKTYTMEGFDNDRQKGIISRTISKIFEETSSLVEKVLFVK